MKVSEMRQLSSDELQLKVKSQEENLFRLRCNKTIGQLEDTSAIIKAKKDIARAKTILTEKQKLDK